MTSTRLALRRWNLRESNRLDEMPAWKKVMSMPLEARKEAFRNKETRGELAEEVVPRQPAINFSRRWDSIFVNKVCRADHKALQGNIEKKSRACRGNQHRCNARFISGRDLDTVFEDFITQGDEKAVAAIFQSLTSCWASRMRARTLPAPIRDSASELSCSVIGYGSGASCPWRKPLEN